MADEPLAQQLVTLRNLLDEVDARLTGPPAAPAGPEDLKGSVDTLRTNVWAVLSAGHGTLAPVRVERLKLRRAIEGILAVRDGLTSRGPVGSIPSTSSSSLLPRSSLTGSASFDEAGGDSGGSRRSRRPSARIRYRSFGLWLREEGRHEP